MFKTDIQSIRQNSNFTIQMEGSKVPDAISTFFRSKQNEIYHQYESARLFLRQAQEGSAQSSWDGWFNRLEDDKLQNMASWMFREKMFQAALMFYNIVVDLSWVLCYTSAEYVVYRDDNSVTFEKLITIEEAYGALRKEEENVVAPNARENPFQYLKKMRPSFAPAVDLVTDFWNKYSSTSIRNLYNFIKHRGKPTFKEVDNAIGNCTLMGVYVDGKACPSDIRDVQMVVCLEECIQELIDFDDTVLFPYINNLISVIEKIIEPSEYVM